MEASCEAGAAALAEEKHSATGVLAANIRNSRRRNDDQNDNNDDDIARDDSSGLVSFGQPSWFATVSTFDDGPPSC
jgi:hypothetical protein